jgi:hypothetical protein
MSNTSDELEKVRKNKKQVGTAESDLSTSKPPGKLREGAAENVDGSESA